MLLLCKWSDKEKVDFKKNETGLINRRAGWQLKNRRASDQKCAVTKVKRHGGSSPNLCSLVF